MKAKQAENRPREGLNTRPLDEKVSGSSKNTFKSEEEEDSARHYPSPAPSSPISEAGTEYVVVLTEDAKAPKAPVTIDSLPTEVSTHTSYSCSSKAHGASSCGCNQYMAASSS